MLNIRKDFPIFQSQPDLVYLDSAATALKPKMVLDKVNEYYNQYSANVHRGLYPLAEKATAEYERAREIVAKFLNAEVAEIVFTKSATEAINLVAPTWGWANIKKGDQIVLTELEHHSNIVPWQLLAEYGPEIVVWETEKDGTLDLKKLDENLEKGKVRLVAVTGMSNVLGTLPPLEEVIEKAHRAGAKVLVDAAQLAAHATIDVKKLDCDFLVFSGHKLYGPTGIGILYGKIELLTEMPPYQGGGEMIREVTWKKTTYKDPPHKFEAGTPPIAQAIGLGAAIEYVQSLGIEAIKKHEDEITRYALNRLSEVPELSILGPRERGPLIAFTLEGTHPHDIATLLGQENICIRGGHHCTMPLHAKLNIPASARASFGVYTTRQDIDLLVKGLQVIQRRFSRARQVVK